MQFGNYDADNATFYVRGRNGYNLTLNGEAGAGTTTTWAGGGNLTFNNESSGLFTFNGSINHSESHGAHLRRAAATATRS